MENIKIPEVKIPKGAVPAAIAVFGLAAVGYAGTHAIFNVEGGHRAVMFNRVSGVNPKIYGEGTHFKIPWFDRPQIFDTRNRPRLVPSLTGSKDLQMVNITLRVLYRPNPFELAHIWTQIGADYDDRILPSIVNEVLKSVVARFNAAQLLTQREQISLEIKTKLMERAKDFRIEVGDVSITQLSFGKEYSAAIEAKQVALQDAERSKFIVEKALQDKRSIVIKAEGEAESAKMINEAIEANPNFLKLRRIEASREIATVMSRSKNRVFLPSDMLLLDLKEGKAENELYAGLGRK